MTCEGTEIQNWKPDYTHKCVVCGLDHVVTGLTDGEVIYQGEMCGVCTWGEADCADLANW
jgi:hypothetical protein